MLTHSGKLVAGFGLGVKLMPVLMPPACPGGHATMVPQPFPHWECVCPQGWGWSSSQNKCLMNIAIPYQTALPLTKGHSYQKVITSSTGALPAAFQGLTLQSYQATQDPAKWKVRAVIYDPTGIKTLTVIADYCGSSSSVMTPDITHVGATVVLRGAWTDIGLGSCAPAPPTCPAGASLVAGQCRCSSTGKAPVGGVCPTVIIGGSGGGGGVQPPAAASSNTGTYVAVGAGVLVLVGAVAVAMSSKKRR